MIAIARANEIKVRGRNNVLLSENPSRSTSIWAGVSSNSPESPGRVRSVVESLTMTLFFSFFGAEHLALIPVPKARQPLLDRHVRIISAQPARPGDVAVRHLPLSAR